MNKIKLIPFFFAAFSVVSCMQAMDDAARARADVSLLFCEDNAPDLVQSFYESKQGESDLYKYTALKRMFILSAAGDTTAKTVKYLKDQIDLLDPTKEHIQFNNTIVLLANYISYYCHTLLECPAKELEDLVEWCIARKAPITQSTHTRTSPLIQAIYAKRPALVKLLLTKPSVDAQHQYNDATPPCTPISYVESLMENDQASHALFEIREALYIAAGIPLIEAPVLSNMPIHHFKAAKLFGVVCVLAAVVGGIAYWWNQKTDKATEDTDKANEVIDAKQVAA